MAVEALDIGWYAFALSREPLTIDRGIYSARSCGSGYWRYELAGVGRETGWAEWARKRFGTGGEWIEFADAGSCSYRGARLVGGRLAGCIFVSPTSRLPDRGWVGRLFANENLIDRERASLLAGRPADGAAPGPVVCACHAVSRTALVHAIADRDARTVKEIGRLLKAGTNCGSCIPELNGLIAEQARRDDTAAAEYGAMAG